MRHSSLLGPLHSPPLALILAILSLPLVTALQPYSINITDQSPVVAYTPNTLGNGSASWNVSYTGSSWASFNSDQTNTGTGSSIHWTNASGATISWTFIGTGFSAFGRLSGQASIVLQLDGSSITTSKAEPVEVVPTLSAASGLQYGEHQATLTMKGTGGMEFTGLRLVLGAGDNGTTTTNITQTAAISNTTLNTAFTWSTNDWAPATNSLNNAEVSFSSHSNASYSFSPPTNTSILVLYGSVGENAGRYSVNLDSSVYSSGSSANATPQSQTFGSLTPWAASDAILYYATLISGDAYKVTVDFLGTSGQDIDLARAVCITTSSTTNTTSSGGSVGGGNTTTPDPSSESGGSNSTSTSGSPGVNVGAVAGGVVGGVVGVAVLAVLLWFLLRRRRRRSDELDSAQEKPFFVDQYEETTEQGRASEATPYTPILTGYTDEALDPPPQIPHSNPAGPGKAVLPATRPGTDLLPPLTQTSSRTQGYTGTGSQPLDGTERDPAFRHKWDILRASLDGDGSAAGGQTDGSQQGTLSSDGTLVSGLRREMDAGRVEGVGEEVLPPDYDPAWLQRARGGDTVRDLIPGGSR